MPLPGGRRALCAPPCGAHSLDGEALSRGWRGALFWLPRRCVRAACGENAPTAEKRPLGDVCCAARRAALRCASQGRLRLRQAFPVRMAWVMPRPRLLLVLETEPFTGEGCRRRGRGMCVGGVPVGCCRYRSCVRARRCGVRGLLTAAAGGGACGCAGGLVWRRPVVTRDPGPPFGGRGLEGTASVGRRACPFSD